MSGKPHKHAELIKAWADGAEIEALVEGDWILATAPSWKPKTTYRIKPKDVVKYRHLFSDAGFATLADAKHYGSKLNPGCVKCTFDSETGKLKSVEIVE